MFLHAMRIRIYYADTDAIGIVYHANYLRFLEAARTEYLRSRGIELPSLLKTHGIQFAVVNIEISYHRSARLDDELVIKSKVSRLGRVSVHYTQDIYLVDTEHLICQANIKLAILDKHLRPARLSEALIREIFHDH